MFCNFCGAANPDVASFCSKCGKAIERPPGAAAVAAPPAAAQPVAAQSVAGQSTAAKLIADVLNSPPAEPVAAQPSAAGSVTYVLQTPYAAPASTPAAVVPVAGVRQEAFAGALTPAARTEFREAYAKEVGRQIDDKCIPASIAAGIAALIGVARFTIPEFGEKNGALFAVVLAFVVAGVVSKIVKSVLEDKYLRPIANLSDEMLVARYNEAKADRRAARTRTAISWAVLAIIAVILLVAWAAARR